MGEWGESRRVSAQGACAGGGARRETWRRHGARWASESREGPRHGATWRRRFRAIAIRDTERELPGRGPSVPDSARIIHAFHALDVNLQTNVHFEWVKSEANIADMPTRNNFGLLHEIGSKQVTLTYISAHGLVANS